MFLIEDNYLYTLHLDKCSEPTEIYRKMKRSLYFRNFSIFPLAATLFLFSCTKDMDISSNSQNTEMAMRSYIDAWKKHNNYRSEISLRNFEHNISFEWDSTFLLNGTWFVPVTPAALIQGDSFKLYRYLVYNKLNTGNKYSIAYYITMLKHNFTNNKTLITDAAKPGNRNIRLVISEINAIQLESPQNGQMLSVRKSKRGSISSNAPLPEGCVIVQIDWYYQIYEGGILVYEEYLFTTNETQCTGGGGGGGGGDTTIHLNNPCDSVNKLATNTEFKSKLDTLKAKASGSNREYSYYYKNTTSNAIEETLNIGDPDSLFVNNNVPTNEKIDGLMHNHFFIDGKSISIFSEYDLLAIIDLYKQANISNPYKFASTMANSLGGTYMLMINDLDAFSIFAYQFSSTDDFMRFANDRQIQFKRDKAGENFSGSNEINFLRLLKLSKSGLKLFRGNSSGGWDPIKLGGSALNPQVVNDPCN